MAGRRKKVWGEPFLDATWEWAGDLGQATGCSLQVCLTPSKRTEVWKVTVRALEVVEGRPVGIRAQISAEWPDASYESLPAALFKLASKLSVELQRDPLLPPADAP